MTWTEAELKKTCTDICAAAGHSFNIPVTINKRLRTTLGRVKGVRTGSVYNPVAMEFSHVFLNTASYDDVIDIIKHECAHYLVGIETHESHGHDAVFKKMCLRIGCTNNKTHTEKQMVPHQKFKYDVVCDSCHEVVAQYHRAGKIIKNIDVCSCGKCKKHTLRIIQNY